MKTRIIALLTVTLTLGCNTHRDIVIKSMRKWEDDAKKCSLLNGNPAIEGMPKDKSVAMYCFDDPAPPDSENWKYTYVGTIKLDNASEADFYSNKWKVDVICSRTGSRTFECVHSD